MTDTIQSDRDYLRTVMTRAMVALDMSDDAVVAALATELRAFQAKYPAPIMLTPKQLAAFIAQYGDRFMAAATRGEPVPFKPCARTLGMVGLKLPRAREGISAWNDCLDAVVKELHSLMDRAQ